MIAGTATAGIPHAAWIAQELNLPMVYVRSKPKDHGRGKQIEGVLEKGQKTIVIDDLLSTGGSVLKLSKLRKTKAQTLSAYAQSFPTSFLASTAILKKPAFRLQR